MAQQVLTQLVEQAFFLAQSVLVQLEAQAFFAQQVLLQAVAQPLASAAQELRANAERATRDIMDRLWITFFIRLLWVVGCGAGQNRPTSNIKSIRCQDYSAILILIKKKPSGALEHRTAIRIMPSLVIEATTETLLGLETRRGDGLDHGGATALGAINIDHSLAALVTNAFDRDPINRIEGGGELFRALAAGHPLD